MDDGVAIEVIHGRHDAVLELLFGCDSDMAQDRAVSLEKKPVPNKAPARPGLDELPGSALRRVRHAHARRERRASAARFILGAAIP